MENFTLKKFGLLAGTVMLSVSMASAQQLVRTNGGGMMVNINGHDVSAIMRCSNHDALGNAPRTAAMATKTPRKVASTKTEGYLIVDEDFSLLTEGTPDEPYTDMPIAYAYGDPGWYVDSKYTHESGWSGTSVYQAGGSVALMDPTGYSGACLNTPMGDYSGDITITFKAKVYSGSSSSCPMFISVVKGGYDNPSGATVDDGLASQQVNLYPGKGWKTVTVTFRNLSADADGYVQFNCYGKAILDDIKVESTTNFLASPKINDISNFTDSTFTANWDPVRAAYNYRVNLYKFEYTGKVGETLSADFESGSLPEGYGFAPAGNLAFAETDGSDGSKAVILHNGDTLTTPYTSSFYEAMTFYMKTVAEEDPDDPYAIYYSYVYIDVETLNGWESLGTYMAYYFMDGYTKDMAEDIGDDFADHYTRFRFRVDGLPDDGYIVLDNFNITTGPEFAMNAVYDDYFSYPGSFYDTTEGNSYTFTGLDPLGDYYYTVQSHYLTMYSEEGNYNYAFGVAAPELLLATDIDDRGSYTANWKTAPKATRYLVTNYGVAEANEDCTLTLLEEDFSKVDASVTSSDDPYNPTSLGNTYEYVSLDDYTQQPGWTGMDIAFAEGYLGGSWASYYYPTVSTPSLYVDNNDYFLLTIEAVGYYGSYLKISDGDTEYSIPYETDDDGATGYIDATYYVYKKGTGVKLSFYDYYGYPFMLDYLKVAQEVKAGSRAYITLGSYEAAADETSHTFTGLDKWGYDKYAYSLMSYYDKGNDTATSDVNGYIIVDLANGHTTTGIDGAADVADVHEIARFSVNGTRLNAPQKGINIVKLSNGRTVKQLVK